MSAGQGDQLRALTGVRFFAAAAVLIFHYGSGYSAPIFQRIGLPEFISRFFANGYLGVSLFFVLSGFILTHSHMKEALLGARLGPFYLARFARIYPVYLFALLLALPTVNQPLNRIEILSVLSLTQAWTRPSSEYGYLWIMQAWTLSVEFVFYLLFPFLLGLLVRMSTASVFCILWGLAGLIIAFGTSSIAPGIRMIPFLGVDASVPLPLLRLPEFVYGMTWGIVFFRLGGAAKRWGASAVQLLLLISMLSIMGFADNVQIKACVTVIVGGLIFSLAQNRGVLWSLLSSKALVFLGGASYALYILQGPVREIMRAALDDPYDRFVSPAATLGLSALVFVVIERPARQWILQRYRKGRW